MSKQAKQAIGRGAWLAAMVAIVMVLVVAVGCRQQTLVEGCGEEPCTPCETDEQCIVVGNPCQATAICAHVDANVAVIEIGCDAAAEYEVPNDTACGCIASACAPR